MTDFGTDVSTFPDLDPAFALISDKRAVGEAIARRLMTPHGSIDYDADYGYDVRDLLNEDMGPAELLAAQSAIVDEAEKDERVLHATLDLVFVPESDTLSLPLTLELADGPFELVLSVGQVGVTIASLG
jgi:hypothetical protein